MIQAGMDQRSEKSKQFFRYFRFTIFNKWYVYVWYSNEVLDKDDDLLNGSYGIISRWKIEDRK